MTMRPCLLTQSWPHHWNWMWLLLIPQLLSRMTPWQGLILLPARLRRLRKMVVWVPWVTRLAGRLVRLMLPRCLMRLMPPLVPQWMARWIKAVHPHRQIREELRLAMVTGCPLKMMAQR